MSIPLRMFALIGLYAALGCTAKEEQTAVLPSSKITVLSPAALSRLEEADKADGAADHVIGKCYVCGLGMNGSEKFAVKVDDYTANLCSEACQHEFEEHADEIVLRTGIPTSTKNE